MSDSSAIRKERTELLVGAFIFVGLAIMGVLVWQFGQFKSRFTEKYSLDVKFDDGTGVVKGAVVRFSGVDVGYVADIPKLSDDFQGVVLPLLIFKDYPIPVGAEFEITTSGLMGDRFININPPKEVTGDLIPMNGVTIEGGGSDLVGELTDRAAAIGDDVQIVLADLTDMVSEIRDVVENLDGATEKFNLQVLSDENLDNFAATMEKLQQTTDNLAQASAGIEPLLAQTRQTVEDAAKPFNRADEAIQTLEPALAELQPAFEELQPLLERLKIAMGSANDAINNADGTIDDIRDGPGVIGNLINNEELAADVSSLIDGLERYGLLGYKKGKERERDNAEDEAEERAEALEEAESGEPEEERRGLRGLFGR